MSHDAEFADAVQNSLGEVYPCDCGGINLAMGPVSLHLSVEEAGQLQALVAAGMEMLHGPGGHARVTHDTEDTTDRPLH